MIVVGQGHAYGMLSQYSSLVWSMIGCPVVCGDVVCLKRERNNNVNVCDHGDDLTPLNKFREDVDWMDLIR